MFDTVAARYDLLNDVLSLGQDRGWRRATLDALAVQPGQLILDVAAGTGTSAAPIAAQGAQVIAVDLSEGMTRQGHVQHPDLDFAVTDALQLPFADATFDATTISFGLRNFADPAAGLCELRRVTKPGGRLVVCEFSTPIFAPLRWAYHVWLGRVIPTLAKLGSNSESYSYLTESILAWGDQRAICNLLSSSGWDGVQYRNLSGGIVALHRGWAR